MSIHFVSKEFEKYDWDVEVDPRKPKGEDEVDVTIVGSGLGGLSCGAMLSKRGYKVLVLEHHNLAGGYCTSFQRKGFIFNTAAHEITGLFEKGPFDLLFKELGLKKEDFFTENSECVFREGKKVDLPGDFPEFLERLMGEFPDEEENISAFFDNAQKAHDEYYKDADIYGTPLPPELIRKAFGKQKLEEYPKECPHYYEWLTKSWGQILDSYFKNEDLKALLNGFWNYYMAPPDEMPALYIFRSYGFQRYGIYCFKGGAQRLADSVKDFIESHGGEVLVRHRVDRIVTENGRVKGVKVGDKLFKSPVVVSNANAKLTLLELVGTDSLDRQFVEYIRGLRMTSSVFMVFLGVDLDLSEYPSIVKMEEPDKPVQVVISSNADPAYAPKGMASVTLMSPLADYYDFPERGTEEYSRKKKELADALIEEAEKVIPGLSGHIVVRDAATPKTLERYTLMPEGSMEGIEVTAGVERPCFKTPIKGLYLAGSSTYPGSGIELVVMSGVICANDICNWRTA